MVNDPFWSIIGDLNFEVAGPPKGDEEAYQTLIGDNKEGDAIIHDPC